MSCLGTRQRADPCTADFIHMLLQRPPASRKQSAISAALTDDCFRKRLTFDIDQSVVGIVVIGISVGKLAHEADVYQVTMIFLLGERLLLVQRAA